MADIPTRIERVELRCSDVEASAEFYGRLVGLQTATLSAERAELRAPGGDRPTLVLHRAQRPGSAPGPAAGLFHTAFRYPTRAGLAASLHRLDEVGAAFTGASDHGVSEALYLDDPDGLGIELYRDRPREQWPEPADGDRIRMFTAPLDLAELASAVAAGGGGSEPRAEPATAAAAEGRERESDTAGGPGTAEGGAGAEPGAGVDIGHVHLKVADTEAAERFWAEAVGMELMARFGAEASFLGRDGYHHHIGANSWHSRGAALEPADGPGLERVAVRGDSGASLRTPDGVAIEVVGSAAATSGAGA